MDWKSGMKQVLIGISIFVVAGIIAGIFMFGSYAFTLMQTDCIDRHGGKVKITEVKEIERSFWGEKCLYETTEGSRVLDCYYEVGDRVAPPECGI